MPLAETGNRTRAAALAGVARTTPYTPQWREDEFFRLALAEAEEAAADLLEAEAYRRAVEGVEKPAGWYKGVAGGLVREYSDVLLIFLLKGIRPDKYKDRMELHGQLANIDLSRLDDETLGRIASGESPYSVLSSWASSARSRGEDPVKLLGLPSGSLDE